MVSNKVLFGILTILLLGSILGLSLSMQDNKMGREISSVLTPTVSTTYPNHTQTVTIEKPVSLPSTVDSITINLDEQNNSSQSGIAKLTKSNKKTVVEIAVSSNKIQSPQPAHIHKGSCPKPGEVLYPLESLVSGVSKTTINVSLEDLLDQLPLAINVHKSEEEANIYVACGNIQTP